MMFLLVLTPPPILRLNIAYFAGRRRVAVARYRMICLVHVSNQISIIFFSGCRRMVENVPAIYRSGRSSMLIDLHEKSELNAFNTFVLSRAKEGDLTQSYDRKPKICTNKILQKLRLHNDCGST